jgi:hypothetical protein
MATFITSIEIQPLGPDHLDRDAVVIVTRAAGDGVRLTSTLTADEVADPEVLAAFQGLYDALVRRMREQAARAWAVSP